MVAGRSGDTRIETGGCAVSTGNGVAWRRGKESNLPFPAEPGNNGFEDREDHQAPITLRTSGIKDWELKVGHLSRGEETINRKRGSREVERRTNSQEGRLHHGADLIDECVFVGKLAGFLLGIDPCFGDIDFIHAAAGGNNLQRSDILPEFEQFSRQTDGAGCVVSSRAVFNSYL